MTWETYREFEERAIENIADKMEGGWALPLKDWGNLRILFDYLDEEELAGLIIHIKHLIVHQNRSAEWIHDTLDWRKKLERRNKGRPEDTSKVEEYARSIAWGYHNTEEDDYWRMKWKEANENLKRTSLWRIRNQLEEEHRLRLRPVHGNSKDYLEKPDLIELD